MWVALSRQILAFRNFPNMSFPKARKILFILLNGDGKGVKIIRDE